MNAPTSDAVDRLNAEKDSVPFGMTEELARRLSAVMFTDVVGYTALMQEDEEAARVVRLRHRGTLEAAIAAHGGELVQHLGDGSLSTFSSVVGAVSAAVEVQQALREDVPLRIGVHEGEIAFDDQGIYGDSVNVAARVMGLGTAGSILVSEKVHDELKNQRDFSTASLGQFDLRNVNVVVRSSSVAVVMHALPWSRAARSTSRYRTLRPTRQYGGPSPFRPYGQLVRPCCCGRSFTPSTALVAPRASPVKRSSRTCCAVRVVRYVGVSTVFAQCRDSCLK